MCIYVYMYVYICIETLDPRTTCPSGYSHGALICWCGWGRNVTIGAVEGCYHGNLKPGLFWNGDQPLLELFYGNHGILPEVGILVYGGMGKYIQLRFTGTAPPRSWKHFVAFSRFSCFGGVAWGALGEGSITFKYRLHIQSMRSAGTRTGDIR